MDTIEQQPLWTMDELLAQCQQTIDPQDLVQADSRVSKTLDTRTVRYYVSCGLVDKPVMSGRKAYWTATHLDQLTKIKKLQAQGKTLAEIKAQAPPTAAFWKESPPVTSSAAVQAFHYEGFTLVCPPNCPKELATVLNKHLPQYISKAVAATTPGSSNHQTPSTAKD